MKNKLSAIIIPFCAFFFLASCGDKSMTKDEKWKKANSALTTSALPSIPFKEIEVFYKTADFIDFIFYDVDFSMSIKDKNNIQRTVAFATPTVATLNLNCKPMGKVFYQNNGEVIGEADMYLGNGCNYFVFIKDGKPTYANTISPDGQAYFNKIFSQVKVEATN